MNVYEIKSSDWNWDLSENSLYSVWNYDIYLFQEIQGNLRLRFWLFCVLYFHGNEIYLASEKLKSLGQCL